MELTLEPRMEPHAENNRSNLYLIFRRSSFFINRNGKQPMDGPVLLCGLGSVGWRVLDCLRSAGLPVVAIDLLADPADPRLQGVRCVRGDFRNKSVLLSAGVDEASGVLIMSSDDFVNISSALMVRSLNPDVRIIVRMFNQNLVSRLGK